MGPQGKGTKEWQTPQEHLVSAKERWDPSPTSRAGAHDEGSGLLSVGDSGPSSSFPRPCQLSKSVFSRSGGNECFEPAMQRARAVSKVLRMRDPRARRGVDDAEATSRSEWVSATCSPRPNWSLLPNGRRETGLEMMESVWRVRGDGEGGDNCLVMCTWWLPGPIWRPDRPAVFCNR
jgi:hypothetical protein